MNILAIDPGPVQSQFMVWDGARVREQGLRPNPELIDALAGFRSYEGVRPVIEMVACYGMPVGRETFETVYWIGRFDERLVSLGIPGTRMERLKVKMHLCHSARAKDSNVRQALLDRFGGRDAALGRKAQPGPLHGVSSHAWAALGLAITFGETG